MKIADAYDSWAASYDSDRNLTRDLDRAVTAEILGPRRFGLVVEAGCGTGKNTPLFAAIGEAVLALDFSAEMLARAERRVAAANVRFERADLLRPWPCGDAVADLVAFHLVLEHVPDLDLVFREAARVLAPAGRLYLSELHPYRQYQGSQARFFGPDGGPATIEAFPHHLSDFLRAASEAGFELERLGEHWHAEDSGKPPRLISILFRRSPAI